MLKKQNKEKESGRMFELPLGFSSIQSLTAEKIHQFIAQSRPVSLQEMQQIQACLNRSKTLIEVGGLINGLCELCENPALYSAFSKKQNDKVRELIEPHKRFRAEFKDKKLTLNDVSKYLKAIKPATAWMTFSEWWNENAKHFLMPETWVKLEVIITKNKPADLEARLLRFNYLKTHWLTHGLCMSIASENLVNLNQACSVTLGKINEALLKDKKYPDAIIAYLKKTAEIIIKLQDEIYCSMLFRLRCAEKSNDLTYDDLIRFTLSELEACGVQFQRLKPSLLKRRGLDKELIKEFLACLKKHAVENKGNSEFAKEACELILYRANNQASDDDEAPICYYLHDRIISIIKQIREEKSLCLQILNANDLTNHVLDNLRRLIKFIPADKKDKEFREEISQYNELIGNIAAGIDHEIPEVMNHLLDGLSLKSKLDEKHIAASMRIIVNANEFNRKYLNISYSQDTDVFLLLAKQALEVIRKDEKAIIPLIRYLKSLLQQVYPGKATIYLDRLEEGIEKIKALNNVELLTMLVCCLESPLESDLDFYQSLQRHRFIATRNYQDWIEPKSNHPLHIKTAFLKNVLLKMMDVSPFIDLDNFAQNAASKFVESLDGMDDQVEMDQINERIQQIMFEKIYDRVAVKRYILNKESGRIDLDKLGYLIGNVSGFFKNNELENKMIALIDEIIFLDIKKKCMEIINDERQVDFLYFDKVSEFLGKNVLHQVYNQVDLVDYIKSNYKNNKEMSKFWRRFIPSEKWKDHQALFLNIAKRRLRRIKNTKKAEQDDLMFFLIGKEHFPAIALKINKYKKTLAPVWKEEIAKSHWQKSKAIAIELLADENEMFAYRAKRILEIIEQERDADEAYSAFKQTLDASRSPQGILSPKTMIKKNVLFVDYLLDLVKNQGWSLLFESIASDCGFSDRFKHMHAEVAKNIMSKRASRTVSEKWLSHRLQEINELNEKEAKVQLLTLFTKPDVDDIVQRMEQVLISLKNILNKMQPISITEAFLKEVQEKIATVSPLIPLYHHFANNKEIKQMLPQIMQIEKELTSSVMKPAVLQDDKKDVTLLFKQCHNMIERIQGASALQQGDVSELIHELNDELLKKLMDALKIAPLDCQDAQMAFDLAQALSSDNMKHVLIKSKQKAFLEKPVWLRFVNNLGKKDAAINLQDEVNNVDMREFMQMHVYINEIKKLFSTNMTAILSHEMNFSIDKEALNHISIQQLLAAWKKTDEVLRIASFAMQKPVFVLMQTLSDEILQRSMAHRSSYRVFEPIMKKIAAMHVDNMHPRIQESYSQGCQRFLLLPLLRDMQAHMLTMAPRGKRLFKSKELIENFKALARLPSEQGDKSLNNMLHVSGQEKLTEMKWLILLYQKLMNVIEGNNAAHKENLASFMQLLDKSSGMNLSKKGQVFLKKLAQTFREIYAASTSPVSSRVAKNSIFTHEAPPLRAQEKKAAATLTNKTM